MSCRRRAALSGRKRASGNVNVQRSALIGRSAGDTFDLIEQAENYPAFLPWCAGAVILERTDDVVAARITFRHRGLEFEMTTRNPKRRPAWLAVRLQRGPFRRFEGEWRLTELAPDACKIEFELNYEFAGGVFDKVTCGVAQRIADQIVHAFARRADHLAR